MRFLLFILLLPVFLLCIAAAQTDVISVPGVVVPDSAYYIAAAVIGIIVKAVASPLTQLLKTRLKFTGNVTRLLYAFLSLVFVSGFGGVTGAFGKGWHGWLSAGLALATALIKGYGDWEKQIDTATVGAAKVLASGPLVAAAPAAAAMPAASPTSPPPNTGSGS